MTLALNSLYLCTKCFELSSHGETSQQCDCEPQKQFLGIDCPSGIHLCYICQIRPTGGFSRWSWEACTICLDVNKKITVRGYRRLLLGRHSVMNGMSLQFTATEDEISRFTENFLAFTRSIEDLRKISLTRTEQMYQSVPKWATLNQIPLKLWVKEFTLETTKAERKRSRERLLHLQTLNPTTL
jgi:hypothetical protein